MLGGRRQQELTGSYLTGRGLVVTAIAIPAAA
jgi:hypothetical protein